MASVPAQQHRERSAKALTAMASMGLDRKNVTPVLASLLKLYGNEWNFIEAENYRALLDHYFETQEAQNSSRGGGNVPNRPVTRARWANSGSDTRDNSDDSPSPLRGASPPPEKPAAMAASHGGRTPRSTTLAAVKKEANSPVSALKDNVARAVEFHSGASVRTRAASQSGPLAPSGSPGTRGRIGAGQNAVAAAHEREKGKSPLVPQSRRPHPPQSRGVKDADPNHVSVRLEVSPSPVSSLRVSSSPVSTQPAPEGFEKVAFERKGGLIIPVGRRPPSNGAVASLKEEEDQRPPLTHRMKIEDETPDQQNGPGEPILSPTPLLAKDPINAAPPTGTQEAHLSPPDQSHDTCEDVNGDQDVSGEPSLEVIARPSPSNLQIVPYGTVFPIDPSTAEQQQSDVAPGPAIDETPKVELEKHGPTVLPANNVEDRDTNILSLVDYEDDDPLEAPEQGTSGAGCDVVLIPEYPPEQVEPPELNDVEIRPNFSGAKRDMVDVQVVIEPKRRKFEVETSAGPQPESGRDNNKSVPSPAHPRRRLILPHKPLSDALDNGDSDCTIVEDPSTGPSSTAGVKRKLILSASASPSPEGSGCLPNGGLTLVRRGGLLAVNDRREDRLQLAPNARGQGNVNSAALKRVKLEPGVVDDNNGQQLKHDPNDISRGTEKVPIPYVNDFTSETIPHQFSYISANVVYQSAYINISLARLGDEDFCLDCVGDCLTAPHSCPCTRETGGEFAYTNDGRLKPALIELELETNQDLNRNMVFCASGWDCPIERVKPDISDKCKGHVARKFVKECWHKCGCSMRCGNRVVQRGICRKLEVFFTNDGKGWGIRTAEDLPAGAFVCEYVGEIMTNNELDQRNQDVKKLDGSRQAGELKDTYPVLLDGDWCSESGLKDEEALCLDATRYGNVARFINHRCLDSNLIDIPVSIETPDRHYYHVAFFTSRDVAAGEELTWDYKIDFDDEEHPIEAFKCLCKSEFCRGGRVTKKPKK